MLGLSLGASVLDVGDGRGLFAKHLVRMAGFPLRVHEQWAEIFAHAAFRSPHMDWGAGAYLSYASLPDDQDDDRTLQPSPDNIVDVPFREFSSVFLAHLNDRAKLSPRRRQHYNIHAREDEPVQRLFNAIEVDSYIRPHRHVLGRKRELLLGIRGRLALITFTGDGEIDRIVSIGIGSDDAIGAELDPEEWHTVIALEPESILFEVKQGPYDPDAAKEMAPWSPPENSSEVSQYLRKLRARVLEVLYRC